jgi:hypothetical protein
MDSNIVLACCAPEKCETLVDSAALATCEVVVKAHGRQKVCGVLMI